MPVEQSEPLQLLFVCTANVCRSPLAEAIANQRAQQARLNVASTSASVHQVVRRPHPWVLAEIASRGLDLGRTVSQPLSAQLVDSADIILTMTGGHAIDVAVRHQNAVRKTFVLDHFVQVIRPPEPREPIDDWLSELLPTPRSYPMHPGVVNVPDPIDGNDDLFRRVADQIDDLVTRIFTTLTGAKV